VPYLVVTNTASFAKTHSTEMATDKKNAAQITDLVFLYLNVIIFDENKSHLEKNK